MAEADFSPTTFTSSSASDSDYNISLRIPLKMKTKIYTLKEFDGEASHVRDETFFPGGLCIVRRVARIFCGGGGVSQEPGPNNERFE